ncbi:dermonecrotic toxin domain-containing protein [Pseudomonas sp. NPDC089422]|uniref:dermonecrotic toxin domain-containing protein n=1 Tax=Pseudomonas sp. NPDC089422 TaxID=3364466 RepID=UPI00381AF134
MTTQLHPCAIQHARDHLTQIPRPDRLSLEKTKAWAQAQGADFDPETTLAVTLHYKPNPEGGWMAQVVEQIPLAQAVLSKWQEQPDNLLHVPPGTLSALNFLGLLRDWSLPQERWSEAFAQAQVQIVDELPKGGLFGTLDDYAVYQGLFRKSQPMQYSRETQVATDTQAFQTFIWALDLHDEYIAQLDNYWQHAFDDYTTLAQVNFLAACNRQVEEGSLSEAGCALAWRSAGIASAGEPSMGDERPFEARMLNVYGYVATDIPCLTDQDSGLTLLYIPGNSSPLHEFENADAMKAWLVEQCKDAEKRKALMAHFRLQDLSTGVNFTGLEDTLKGLANYRGPRFVHVSNLIIPARGWSTDYINYKTDEYSPLISEGLFGHIATRQKLRSYEDTQFLITTNSDVIKAKWRGYLNLTITLLAPLTLVVPGLGWVVAIGGIAQLGLGLDEVINGKNLEEKVDGAVNAAFGALCALPLAANAWSASKQIFQTQFDGFVAPERVNGQIGYPLSPIRAPRTRWTGHNFETFFEQPVPVEPLPAPAPQMLISRQTTHVGMDTLVDTSNPATHWVYELETDAFVKTSDLEQHSPERYIAQNSRLRVYRPEINGPRVVTDAMRESTLRTLGIEISLPIEVPRVPEVNQVDIPKRVMHLWVSDDLLAPDMLTRIARNSRLLRDAGYGHCLYLSEQNAAAFNQNARALAVAAPNLQVLPLERQGFFANMGHTRRYYDAAMQGPARGSSHLTAATDMLKYHALHENGGLYMDIGNDLLAPPAHPSAAGITNEASPSDWIGNIPLRTTPDGLLLEQPTSNPFKGVHQQYNTSVIGSHPGNPTLMNVIRNMDLQLDTRPGFFTQSSHWPGKGAHAPKYATYARALSELTGIGMFNQAVDQSLPTLRQMKKLYKLLSCPLLNAPTLLGADLQPVSNTELQTTLQSLFRVSRVVRVNNGFGWRNLNH